MSLFLTSLALGIAAFIVGYSLGYTHAEQESFYEDEHLIPRIRGEH